MRLILCAIAAASSQAQVQRLDFDDAVDASNVTWTFERDTVSFGADGDMFAPDVARFARPTLLAGAPAGLMEVGPIGSVRPLTAGVSADGEPVLVVMNGPHGALDIHVGADAEVAAYIDGDYSNTYRIHYVDPDEDDEQNLLRGQTGLDGGTPAIPTYAFTPRGAQVYDGLIAVQCDVRHDHDNNDVTSYRGIKTALLWTTVERLKTAQDPWIVGAVSAPYSVQSFESGQSWSINAFPLGPDQVAVAVSSYQTSQKYGGHCYVVVFSRDGEWSVAANTFVDASEAGGEHYHCAGIIRHPDGRISILASVGDGIAHSRLIARTKNADAEWASAVPWTNSGIQDQFMISMPAVGWSEPVNVWGDNDPETPRMANQFIDVVAADEDLSALICAADENHAVIKRLEYDPDEQRCTWTPLYMPAVSSWPNERPVALSLEGAPGGPYVARLGAQSWASGGYPESRVLYSPDGVSWTQCLAPYERAQSPVAIANGRIWVGHIGSTTTMRRLDAPATRTARPLQVADAGENYLSPAMQLPTNLGPGVVVTKLSGVADLPAGSPPPPCDDANMFRITAPETSGAFGVWRPVGADPVLPRPKTSVLIRYWLYAPGPDGAEFVEPSSITLWSRVQATDGSGAKIDPGRIGIDPGVWTPVTVWFDPEMFGAEVADPWSFETLLYALALTPQPAPSEFFIAWEGVYLDRATIDGHAAPPQSPAAEERGYSGAWSLGDAFTLIGYGAVPYDAWDNRMGGGHAFNAHQHTLLRLLDSDTGANLDIRAWPVERAIGLAGAVEGERVAKFTGEDVFWLRESPILFALVCDGESTTLHASVGGSPITKVQLTGVAPLFDVLELGHSPMVWHTIQGAAGVKGGQQVHELLTTLGDLEACPADLNGDGVLNILDFVAFQLAFIAKEPDGDCNGDGFFDILDFVCFQQQFVAGCP